MSTHYKLPWFVRRVSSAPAHIRIFKGTGWSVSNIISPLLWTMAHPYAVQPLRFRPHTLHLRSHSGFNIIIFKHALLQNPRCHRACSLHNTRLFCSCLVCSSHFQLPGLPFLTDVIALLGITNDRPAPPLRKRNQSRVAVAFYQIY